MWILIILFIAVDSGEVSMKKGDLGIKYESLKSCAINRDYLLSQDLIVYCLEEGS